MRPTAFALHRPTSLAEAIDLMADLDADSALLAGGQSLIPLMNARAVRPTVVVDLNGLHELATITVAAELIRIGGLARLAALQADAGLAEACPIIAEVTALVGHPQIRTRSTIAGSLCHANPAAELPTLCVALGAILTVQSAGGARVLPVEELAAGPFRTSLAPGEIVTKIEFRRSSMRYAFEEFSRRPGRAPLVGACVGLETEGGAITAATIAVGGVGERPVRLVEAERLLVGAHIRDDISPVLRSAAAAVNPPSDAFAGAAFRCSLMQTLIQRAYERLARTPKDNA